VLVAGYHLAPLRAAHLDGRVFSACVIDIEADVGADQVDDFVNLLVGAGGVPLGLPIQDEVDKCDRLGLGVGDPAAPVLAEDEMSDSAEAVSRPEGSTSVGFCRS
jgi:hypothetical protein